MDLPPPPKDSGSNNRDENLANSKLPVRCLTGAAKAKRNLNEMKTQLDETQAQLQVVVREKNEMKDELDIAKAQIEVLEAKNLDLEVALLNEIDASRHRDDELEELRNQKPLESPNHLAVPLAAHRDASPKPTGDNDFTLEVTRVGDKMITVRDGQSFRQRVDREIGVYRCQYNRCGATLRVRTINGVDLGWVSPNNVKHNAHIGNN